MKKLAAIALLVLSNVGCAHMTAEQKCLKDDKYKMYNSLESCMDHHIDDVTWGQALGAGLKQMGDGIKSSQGDDYDCKSVPAYDGMGGYKTVCSKR